MAHSKNQNVLEIRKCVMFLNWHPFTWFGFWNWNWKLDSMSRAQPSNLPKLVKLWMVFDSLQIYLFWSSFPKTQVGHIVPLALSHWRLRSALCNQVFQPVPDERRDEQTWGMLQHRVYRIPLSSNQQHPRWKDFVCNGNVRSPFGVTIPYTMVEVTT